MRRWGLIGIALAGLAAVGLWSWSTTGAPKYGPVGRPDAAPISSDHSYFQSADHPAPDYWAISPYYVSQLNSYSCSVASVAAVVNALTRAGRTLRDADQNATHESLLESVKVARWPERMGKNGLKGVGGLTLDQLEEVVAESLRKAGIANPVVEKTTVTSDDAPTREAFRRALIENEKSADDMILIHFTQDTITHAAGGPYPHISPIGAFDVGSGRALVMDVDREYYEPYWTRADVVVRAMAAKTWFFGHGGWIRVGISRR